jgi:isopropylmalate/homocitrate/citramalate synthase
MSVISHSFFNTILKVKLVNLLSETGLSVIEATAFVNKDKVRCVLLALS